MFFFYKQKTAYEMRISDWSSDVCSSDLPVIKGLNLNAAGRFTDYSTSGSVQTWKVGGTFQPIPDIRFRGNVSHDIRAPNLQELFAAGTARTNTVIIPRSEAHTSELQSLMRISYAVFCLKKNTHTHQ